MAFNYLGRWADVLLSIEVGNSTFLKFSDKKQQSTIWTRVSHYSNKSKRTFTTETIGNQVKVTRTK